MSEIKYKSYTTENNSFDENERSVISFISTISPDRYDEIVMPEGVDTKDYEKNPVVLLNHTSPLPIGKNLWIKKEVTGIKAKTQFADTELANDVMKLYKGGFMRAFSIGFKPIKVDFDEKKRKIFTQSELYEYSAVTIPANQDALMLSYKSVQSKELREILEREIKEVEIYEKMEAMKQDIYKTLETYKPTIIDEDILKSLNRISELEDKINQLNETINQFQSEQKKLNYQKQLQHKLETMISNKLKQ